MWLVRSDGAERRAHIRNCWISPSRGGQAIFHFEGCDSISEAEAFVGMEVQVPLKERATLSPRQHYVSDLVGCEVWERAAGAKPAELLGSVHDVDFPGGTPLLVVHSHAGELLIPLAEEICVLIDPPARRIEVVLPQGLRELNT